MSTEYKSNDDGTVGVPEGDFKVMQVIFNIWLKKAIQAPTTENKRLVGLASELADELADGESGRPKDGIVDVRALALVVMTFTLRDWLQRAIVAETAAARRFHERDRELEKRAGAWLSEYIGLHPDTMRLWQQDWNILLDPEGMR